MIINRGDLNRLFRYALALCHREEEAKDLLQSNVEKFLKKVENTEIDHPIRYIMRSIRNEFYNSQKRNQLLDKLEEVEVENSDLEELSILKQEVQLILANCDPEEREILFLWAYEDMSYQEIADFHEVSRSTLLSKIHRLKKRLLKQGGDNV